MFDHRIMVPFNRYGTYTVKSIASEGDYVVTDQVAVLEDANGNEVPVTMMFEWPVKRAITNYEERLKPTEQLITKVRIIDTFLPVARGGTFCVPGPFGAGKTVLQQVMSRNAEVDIVIVAACGERAGEVVETLKEFPELIDPRTGKTLMERTVIICNTSSMPVAAREASVYTAVTIAEYYRQMGLNILLLADSTSRWAQAMREMSGRLEEIPGEEAFPAYLESVIASFYERAGLVRLNDGSTGSVTIGGTVSPAGGNFEEPVTQATLKVVGAFHGLSRDRANARKYPSIHPLDSWSKYEGAIDSAKTEYARSVLFRGNEVGQMMKVVGEEGTSLEDYLVYLKSEFIDAVYLQQDSFDPVDASVSKERQEYIFSILLDIITASFDLSSQKDARNYFNDLRQNFKDFNGSEWMGEDFKKLEKTIRDLIARHKTGVVHGAEKIMAEAR
jgi:V/A-type H+-transporting ATPase subunit A